MGHAHRFQGAGRHKEEAEPWHASRRHEEAGVVDGDMVEAAVVVLLRD